ncbi:PAS domain S-box protein [Myxococcaceae bacterium GXIMD 01537]
MTGPLRPPSFSHYRAFALGTALTTAALGVLGLTSWTLGLESLRTVVPGTPGMTPNSAVALLLLAASLALLRPPEVGLPRRLLGQACAAAALLLGALTLGEHLTGKDFGSDGMLYAWTEWAQRTPPARPSANAASCVVLLGASLLLLERRVLPRVPWTNVLVPPVLLSALLVINAYAHGGFLDVMEPEQFAHTGMGLLTSLAMLLMGLSILCVRPERGVMALFANASLGGTLARRLVPLALVGPPLAGLLLKVLAQWGLFGPEAKLPLLTALASAGGVIFVLLSAWGLDIADAQRVRARATLAASETHFRGVLETAPDPVVIVDAEGRMSFVNAETERVFGYRRDELLGQPVELLIPERLREHHRELRKAYVKNPPKWTDPRHGRPLLARRKDGGELTADIRLSPFISPEGLTVTVILRDVTARERYLAGVQRARGEAEEQRARLQTVLDHTPVGILFVEPGTGHVFANPTLEQLLGRELRAEAGRQQYLSQFHHIDGRPLRLEELPSSRAMEGQPVEPEEYLLRRTNGRMLPVVLAAVPVRGHRGEVLGVVGTMQDVSARHELERLREEYLGLVSHDLRNPLSNISLRAQMLGHALRERGLTREQCMAEAILQGTRRMDGMIEELLESARLESGRVELSREAVDLSRFMEGVLERDVPPGERERFTLEVAGPVPPISVDAARLERVVANLLTNAMKYTPARTPVRVRLAHQDTQVVVSVRDAGPGLTPGEMAHLFQKYARAQSGRKAGGTGLGLYISRLIVEAHGGRIWVEASPGGGATFSFTLPLEAADAARPAAG